MSTASPSTKSKKDSSTVENPAGRFAPSPTGPLHLGSLLAATASFLDSKARGGAWHVRIDDLDEPRSMPGAEQQILDALEAHGLYWDGTVTRQSDRLDHYADALDSLNRAGRLYRCHCSRRSLKGHPTYPGTCRHLGLTDPDTAVRVIVPATAIEFEDAIRGRVVTNLQDSVGDFIVRRRDGLFAYQLATAVDDGEPDITHVVRGSDLLDNTARQLFLIQALDASPPSYAHVPTLLGPTGDKLSKQTKAPPLEAGNASRNLLSVLALLGQAPPPLTGAACTEILDWGVQHWSLARVPGTDQQVRL